MRFCLDYKFADQVQSKNNPEMVSKPFLVKALLDKVENLD